MNKKDFTIKINFIFEDKNIEKPSIDWLNSLYEKCKDIEDKKFNDGVERVISISQEKWNKKYGFKGRPSIIDFIEILSGERPLTEAEKIEANNQHNEKISFWVASIAIWLEDKNLSISFKNKYSNKENYHLSNLIDVYSNRKPSNEEEIIKLGVWLAKRYNANKNRFKNDLKAIASKINPSPFFIKNTEQKTFAINLPIFKNFNN